MFQELLKILDFQIFGHMLIWDAHFFNFIFVQFMQFPELYFGLAHSGSRPFICAFISKAEPNEIFVTVVIEQLPHIRGTATEFMRNSIGMDWSGVAVSLIYLYHGNEDMNLQCA